MKSRHKKEFPDSFSVCVVSIFSCFWEEDGIAEERSKPILLFLFQSWKARSDCEIKGYPTKRSRISEALATALRLSKKCLIQQIYCPAQVEWEEHWNYHLQSVPCSFDPALLQVLEWSQSGQSSAWSWTPAEREGWRESVVVMGSLEKKEIMENFWSVFFPSPGNEIKLPPPLHCLEPEPLSRLWFAKAQQKFPPKGEHRSLCILDALVLQDSLIQLKYNTIHSCEAMFGNWFLYLIEHLY